LVRLSQALSVPFSQLSLDRWKYVLPPARVAQRFDAHWIESRERLPPSEQQKRDPLARARTREDDDQLHWTPHNKGAPPEVMRL